MLKWVIWLRDGSFSSESPGISMHPDLAHSGASLPPRLLHCPPPGYCPTGVLPNLTIGIRVHQVLLLGLVPLWGSCPGSAIIYSSLRNHQGRHLLLRGCLGHLPLWQGLAVVAKAQQLSRAAWAVTSSWIISTDATSASNSLLPSNSTGLMKPLLGLERNQAGAT